MGILIASNNPITILAHRLTAVVAVHTGKSTEYERHIILRCSLFGLR
jgi:hypothetical protein